MSQAHSWKSYGFVVLLLILQIVVYFVVYANVPIARMAICFLYLMFIPGLAILKLLKLENLDTGEKALFSTGLSIAFIMLIGLFINQIGRLAIANPLSLNLMLFSMNSVVLLISIVVTRHDSSGLMHLPQLKRSEWLFSILLVISLFAVGSYGTVMVNSSGNSSLLLLLIIVNSIVISLVFLSGRIFSSKLYSLVLLVICICMVFFVGGPLITKYISGAGDGWIEFYAFRLTNVKGFWDSALAPSPYTPNLFPTYSMASVTVLPQVFTIITGLDGSSLFQILYPLILVFLALGSYKLYQTQIESKAAFLATFFLIIISVGKGWGSYKQQVAGLFYVSLFLLLFKKGIPASKRNILFVILGAGLVLSHYALAYIFLLTIVVAFVLLALVDYLRSRETDLFSNWRRKISFALVLTFLTITFCWYVFVNSSATFDLLSQEINSVTSNLNQFFNPQSRGTALQGLGIIQPSSILNSVSIVFFLASEFLLFVGFVVLMTSKKRSMGFSIEYKAIAAINMAIIAIDLLLPRIADTFLMERFYQTTLIILAPLAILGGKTIIELMPRSNIRKLYAPILVFVLFIPLFLFQTGFVYEVAKLSSSSPSLSMYRWDSLAIYGYFVNASEVTAAQWLPRFTNTDNIYVYSDAVSLYNVLTGYGMMERGRIFFLSNTTSLNSNDFIYLANVRLINQGYIFNASQIAPILENQNILYSNGESEIYGGK